MEITNKIFVFIKRLSTLLKHTFEDIKNMNKQNISLGPLINGDKIDNAYFNELSQAINNPSNYNIGVIGKNGVGKSSVINSYCHQSSRTDVYKISLADFELNKNFNNYDINEIERSILQQIFYKTRYQKIPLSRFSRIKHRSFFSSILLCLFLLVMFGSIMLLFYPSITGEINNYYNDLDEIISIEWIKITLLSFCLLTIFTVLVYLTHKVRNLYVVTRIFTKNLEITTKKDSVSINKHLDEIIYFFERTNTKILVFEDLDRLLDNRIIIKLRELNNLLNNSNVIKNKITFIYAISDSMFNTKNDDKTKFFDYIVTVIPTVTSANSNAVFKGFFDKNDSNVPSEEAIDELLVNISDFRMLKNIYIEFKHMSRILENNKLSKDKLLGFIVYKNLYPRDYSLLHNNKGIINLLFKKKPEYLGQYVKTKKEEEKKLIIEKKRLDDVYIKSLSDLRYIYLAKLINASNYGNLIVYNNTYKKIDDFITDDFENLPEKVSVGQPRFGNSLINFKNILKSTKPTYYERKNDINKIKNKEIEDQIKNIRNEINRISDYNLSDIITNNINLEINFPKKIPDVMLFLIRRKYIEDDFYDYMTVIDQNDRTSDDIDFIRAVQHQEEGNFELKISKPEKVLKSINRDEFGFTYTLNRSLIDYFIDNDCKDYLTKQIEMFEQNKEYSNKYIKNCIHEDKYFNKYISLLTKYWKSGISHLINSSYFIKEDISEFFKKLFELNNNDILLELNNNDIITNYIRESQNLEYLVNEISEISFIKNIIKLLDVKITNITIFDKNSDMYTFVKEGNYYEINIVNIKHLFQFNSTNNLLSQIIDSNSLIKQYVQNNLEKSIYEIVLYPQMNNIEMYEYVINWINNGDLGMDCRLELVHKLDLKYDLSKIDNDDIKSFAVNNYKAEESLLTIYWFERNESEFEKNKDTLQYYLDKLNVNTKDIYINSSIIVNYILYGKDQENIKNLLTYISEDYKTNVIIDRISEYNLLYVIENNFYEISKENTDKILNKSDIVIEKFISNNFEYFIKYLEENSISLELHKTIQRMKSISIEQKIKIIELDYEHNGLSEDQIIELFSEFVSSSAFDNYFNLTTKELKLLLLVAKSNDMDRDKFKLYCGNLDNPYKIKLISKSRPRVNPGDKMNMLLSKLIELDLINEPYQERGVFRVYVK